MLTTCGGEDCQASACRCDRLERGLELAATATRTTAHSAERSAYRMRYSAAQCCGAPRYGAYAMGECCSGAAGDAEAAQYTYGITN